MPSFILLGFLIPLRVPTTDYKYLKLHVIRKDLKCDRNVIFFLDPHMIYDNRHRVSIPLLTQTLTVRVLPYFVFIPTTRM